MNIKTLSIHSKPRTKPKGGFAKRIFDLCFSLSMLVFLTPLFLIISFLIYLFAPGKGPGKVIFSQERLGLGGKVFKCYKFRTMHFDAEERLEEILLQNSSFREEWNALQKLKCDPRIFSFGKFLRRTSLDEIPQFWNVLKGDLSIVGPRPYMTSQLEDMGSYAKKILSVLPGITGIWQTSGRSSTTFQTRLELDAQYVDRKSFWLDLVLILKTIPAIFFSKNAC